jgi:hypothetical protein
LANLGKENIPPILNFTTCLFSYISEPEIKNGIRKWNKEVSEDFGLIQTHLEELFKSGKQFEFVEEVSTLSLLIELTPAIQNKYTIQAWLQESRKNAEKIEIQGKAITLDDMPELIGKLLDEISAFFINITEELTIEFFLPIQLLSYDIEHWRPKNCKPIGIDYRVIIRSAERFRWGRLQIQWHKHWNRCKDVLQNKPKNFEICLNESEKTLRSKLDKCLIFFNLSFVPELDFMDKLIQAGTPLVLWSRQDNQETYKKINTLLLSCNKLEEIPELVRQERINIWDESNGQHIGHISLLWDTDKLPPLPPLKRKLHAPTKV